MSFEDRHDARLVHPEDLQANSSCPLGKIAILNRLPGNRRNTQPARFHDPKAWQPKGVLWATPAMTAAFERIRTALRGFTYEPRRFSGEIMHLRYYRALVQP